VRKLLNFYKAIGILIGLMLAACSPSDKSDINTLLDARNAAIHTRDIATYNELLTKDYPDKLQIIEQIRSLFSRFEQIDMHSQNRHIRILDDNNAECEQSYTLKAFADGQWRNIVQREQLQFRHEDNHWRISGGL